MIHGQFMKSPDMQTKTLFFVKMHSGSLVDS